MKVREAVKHPQSWSVYLDILLAANTERGGVKMLEILEEKWGLGGCRSWVCGVGEAVIHLPREVLAPLATLSLHPLPIIYPTVDFSCENSLNSNLSLSPCPTLGRLSPIRGNVVGS